MPVRVLVRYVVRDRGRYAVGFGFLLATNACALAIPWFVKVTIEGLSAGGPAAIRAAATGALGVVGLACLQGMARSASRLLLLGAGQRVEARIRQDLFERLLRLPPAYYQTQRTGDLVSRATNDLQNVAALIGFGLLSLANTVLVYAGALTAMLRIDSWLTVAALLPYPFLIVLVKRYNARVHVESLAVQEQLGDLSTRVQENLTGAAVVRAYTMEAAEIAAFRRLNAEQRTRVLRLARSQGLFSPLMGAIVGLGVLTVLWLGGRAVMDGRITFGAFVAFSSYLAYLTWPTIALGWVLSIIRRGLVAMGRIVEVLEARPDGEAVTSPVAESEARGPIAVAGAIELKGLTFAYETDRAPALLDVSLTIPAGAFVALVGPTGSGKSTLARLLARLWDPPRDTIFIDGREIQSIPVAELRRAVGVVPQEAFLFSRSLAENVVFGADPGRLEWAARVAGLVDDVARFPDGWQTVVGERGLTLSGGQRQRATLARTLLRDPRILLLDDAFASVDAEKEAEILTRLRETLAGRTTIVITHRLRAARLADRVIVLDAGRVAEQGTHAALLARGGLYARLWRRGELETRLGAAG